MWPKQRKNSKNPNFLSFNLFKMRGGVKNENYSPFGPNSTKFNLHILWALWGLEMQKSWENHKFIFYWIRSIIDDSRKIEIWHEIKIIYNSSNSVKDNCFTFIFHIKILKLKFHLFVYKIFQSFIRINRESNRIIKEILKESFLIVCIFIREFIIIYWDRFSFIQKKLKNMIKLVWLNWNK